MKFYCDNCQAKYSIADEKVRGKVLKVRCKKCAFVITVREPRAPVAQHATRPAPSATIPWYYALNGQTFGPYEDQDLMRMFESGELGDACYVWNESFTEWLPVRQVSLFVPALNHGAKIRPRHKTIGVSGALSAIKIDQIDPAALASLQQPAQESDDQEEAGAVPGQMADRIDKLRERLKQHNLTPDADDEANSPLEKPVPSLFEKKPAGALFAARHAQDEEDSTTQMSVAEISGLLDLPQGLGGGSTEAIEELHIESSDEALPVLNESEDLMGSLFPTPGDDGVPAFIGAATPEDNAIDFSRLEKQDDDQTAHSGLFADSAANFVPPPTNSPDQFQASNSLLIQMDSIKKEGRGKRVMAIAIAAVLFVSIGVVAVIASQNAEKSPKDDPIAPYDPSKKELTFNTYDKDELNLYELEIDDEVISADTKLEGDDPEEDEPKTGGKAPVKVARNDVVNKPNKGVDPLRGIDALLNNKGSAQDNALESSTSTKKNGSGAGLSTTKTSGGKSVSSSESGTSKKTFNAPNIRQTGGPRASTGPKFRGVDTGKKDAAPTLGAPGTLSPADAKKGFRKVSRSVQSCHQRQVTRGLPLDAPKVHITLEIKGDGSVSSLKIEPSSVRSSEFATCLESHRKGGRWPFAEFSGKNLKIRHTYVLQ